MRGRWPMSDLWSLGRHGAVGLAMLLLALTAVAQGAEHGSPSSRKSASQATVELILSDGGRVAQQANDCWEDGPADALCWSARPEGQSRHPGIGAIFVTEESVFRYETVDITAVGGDDYAVSSGTLTINEDQTTARVEIPVYRDGLDEDEEIFAVRFDHVSGPELDGGSHIVMPITDVDDPPELEIRGTEVEEGERTFWVPVQLGIPSAKRITVDYATSDGTALAGSDYEAASGTLTFEPGETLGRILLTTIVDAVAEAAETFTVTVSNPVNVSLDVDTATVTIKAHGSGGASLSVGRAQATEASTLAFEVLLVGTATGEVTVDYETDDESAVAGSDYTAESATLTFPLGDTARTITITTLDDSVDEPDETMSVRLKNPSGATISQTTGSGLIVDDDDPPAVSVDDATVAEGAVAQLPVKLGTASAKTIVVGYRSVGGTAFAGLDYLATAGQLTFAPGTTSLAATVTTLEDALDEDNETFTVELRFPQNVTLGTDTATATITDNDDPPAVMVERESAREGTNLDFVLTLGTASSRTITVDYDTPPGTAQRGVDYRRARGTLTFAPTETEKTISVRLRQDTVDEDDETFSLVLSNFVNATGDNTPTTGTILDDDDPPTLSIDDDTGVEGASLAFVLSLDNASGRTVTVDYATGDDTALAGADYEAVTGTLTIAPGSTSGTVSVRLLADDVDEPEESLQLSLSNPVAVTLPADPSALGTIADANDPPTLGLVPGDAVEASGELVFEAELSQASAFEVTVDYATSDASAKASLDYEATTGTLTIEAGDTTGSIRVPILDDSLDELDERVRLELTSPVYATLAGGGSLSATGKIRDDDDPPGLAVGEVAGVEGEVVDFTVGLGAASGLTVTVDFQTADDTAVAGDDYAAAMGSLTFVPGETSATVAVRLRADGLDEPEEKFELSLSAEVNAVLDDGTATGTIIDADPPPSLRVVDAVGAEGDVVEVAVELDVPSGRTVTVRYATADGSATAGGDYEAVNGELPISPGATEASIAVRLLADGVDEGEESFEVALSSPNHATVATGVAEVRIVDIDGAPRLLVAGGSAAEGGVLAFTVNLAGSTTQAVTVDYETQNGTAVAGLDFDAVSGTLTLAPGESSATVEVSLLDDMIDEAVETFALVLAMPENADLATERATGTILDTDDAPSLAVADAAGGEGGVLSFRVSLDGESARPVTVDFATTDGTAVADVDYEPAAGTLTFSPGEAAKMVAVSLADDDVHETRETFALTLSLPTHATLVAPSATGTIEDADPPPTIDVAGASGVEGGTARFVVVLTGATAVDAVVGYATSEGTAHSGSDYEAVDGRLTFAPGDTHRTVAVALLQDTVDEPEETFRLALSSPVNATLASASAEGRIVDDDGPPLVSVVGVSGTEGEIIEFSVTLTGTGTEAATVAYATTDLTATAGEDYEPTTGILTFQPGTPSGVVPVRLLDDALDEAQETFSLVLSAPMNAVLSSESATGTILDDDPPPTLTVAGGTGVEGTTVEFVVGLSGASGLEVSVFYETLGGSATPGTDYEAASGVLTLAPGATEATVVVRLLDDTAPEEREAFSLELSEPRNVVIATPSATGTILDDDAAVGIGVTGAEAGEADGTLSFTVRLDSADHGGVTAAYATADGTALAGDDYEAVAGALTFARGEREKTIDVTVLDDLLDEDDESFTLELTDLVGAMAEAAVATGTILDDDAAPGLSVADASVAEDAGELAFVVTLDAPSGRRVSVFYATADGTAEAGTDYEAATGKLMFAPGRTNRSVTVRVFDDAVDEPDEDLTLTLSAAEGATLSRAAATGTIEDDDLDPPTVATSASLALCVGGEPGRVDLADLFSGAMLTYTVSSGDASVATAMIVDGTLVVAPDAEGRTAVSVTATNASGEASTEVDVVVTADPAELAALDASLALAGRSLLADTVATVESRFVDPGADPDHAPNASGQPPPAFAFAGTPSGPVLLGWIAGASDTEPARRRGLSSQPFAFASATSRSPGWSFWGRGGGRRFEVKDGDGTDIDGSLNSVRIGADTHVGDWIVGISAAWNTADASYRFQRSADACGGGGVGEGMLELELASVTPYLGRRLGDGWIWAAAGAGQGEAVVKRCESGRMTDADLDVRLAALGGRHPFVQRERLSLSVMEDVGVLAMSTGMSSGPVADREVTVGRARLGLELAAGGHSADGKSSVTAYLRTLARRDWGDGTTGTGLEVSAGLRYRHPTRRLGIDAGLGTLAISAVEDATEHSADVALSILPRADGTGLHAALTWRAGANGLDLAATDGVSPWTSAAGGDWRTGSRQDWTAQTRLGFGITGRRGLATPFVELDSGGRANRDVRLGLEHRFGRGGGGIRLDWGILLGSDRSGPGKGVFLNATGQY